MPAIIDVHEQELSAGVFEMRYDCVRDQYSRPMLYDAVPQTDFLSVAEKEGGVFRKVEPEWRAFLTSDGPGLIRYTVRHPGARVKTAQALFSGVTTFRQGQVGLQLRSGEKVAEIPLTNDKFLAEQQGDRIWGLNREPVVEKLIVDEVGPADQTMVVIKLNDQTKNEGLDHDLDDAQIFRNPLAEPNAENLVIRIEFEKREQKPESLIGWNVQTEPAGEMTNTRVEVPREIKCQENQTNTRVEVPQEIKCQENMTNTRVEVPKVQSKIEADSNADTRTEAGPEAESQEDPVIKLTDLERAVGHFELKYDSVRDQYTRPYDPRVAQPIRGYESLAARRAGVFRKVEPEWRAFLTSKGAGAIQFTILHPGARVKSAEMRMNGVATFRAGQIGAQLKSGDKKAEIPLTNDKFLAEQQGDRVWGLNREPMVEKLIVDRVGPADQTRVRIMFDDRTENQELDHDLDDAQVFRTPVDKPDTDNMVIHIEFEPSAYGPKTDNVADPQNIEAHPAPAAEPEVNAVTDVLGTELAKGAGADKMRLRELLIQITTISIVKRYRIVQLVRVKYGIELAQTLQTHLSEFKQLINVVLLQQLISISSVVEEQQITKQIAQMQTHQPGSDYAPVSALRASPEELQVARCFLLKYDCAQDAYKRPFNLNGQRTYAGYASLVHASREVQRMTDKNRGDEYTYIGSDGEAGELVWRIEHPGTHVQHVQVLISGMATLDDDARIGVDLRCGAEESERRPDAIPYNAQRIDVMEMENVGPANFTEVRVKFIRDPTAAGGAKKQRQPSQLFRAVFGDAATADDFVIRIEYAAPAGSKEAQFDARKETLAQELQERIKALRNAGNTVQQQQQIVQIITIVSTLTLTQRRELVQLVRTKYNIDLRNELKAGLPKESGADLVEQLFNPPTEGEKLEQPNEEGLKPTIPVQNLVGKQPSPSPTPLDPAQEAADHLYTAVTTTKIVDPAKLLLTLISTYSITEMRQIVTVYRQRHPDKPDLVGAIAQALKEDKSLTEEQRKELASGIVNAPAQYDAELLRRAMKGLGTTESVLIEILTSRSYDQLQEIKSAYRDQFGRELEKDVAEDTSGKFKQFLLGLLNNPRRQEGPVDKAQAEKDAQRILSDNGKQSEDPLLSVLQIEFFAQLRAIFWVIHQKTGDTVEKLAEKRYSGDTREAMVALIRNAKNQPKYFADKLPEALKSKNKLDLIRILITRRHIDLANIADEYRMATGEPLEEAVKKHTKDSLQKILVAVVQSGKRQTSVPEDEQEQVPIPSNLGMEETAPTKFQQEPNGTPKVLDLEQAAELIHKSIHRSGGGAGLMKMFKKSKSDKSDTEQILNILMAANYNTRQLIQQTYKRRYEHEDLVDTLKKELHDDSAKDLILALLYSPEVYDAVSLHKAMKGIGTAEHVLTEILVTRDNARIRAIRKAYTELYHTQLEQDIGGDTSGTYKRLLLYLCAANRDESGTVNGQKAKQDAQTLYSAGKQKLGTDEDTFLAIFTRENQLQLNALFHEYETLTGNSMEKALDVEFSGDTLEALRAIVQHARNPARYFADRLNAAVKKQSERDLIRLVVTRTDSGDMPAVAAEFKRTYGLPLGTLIGSESKAITKTLLINLIKQYGGQDAE